MHELRELSETEKAEQKVAARPLTRPELAALILDEERVWRQVRDATFTLGTLSGTLRLATQAIKRHLTPTHQGAAFAEGSSATEAEREQIELLLAAGIWLAGKRGITQANIARTMAVLLAESFYTPPPAEPPIP